MDKIKSNDFDQESKVTIDHDEIIEWVSDRGGTPSIVKGTRDGENVLLRIDFGDKEENLESISWDEFFKVFEDKNLAFLYQENTAGGGSRFFKFIERDSMDDDDEEDDAHGEKGDGNDIDETAENEDGEAD